MNNRITRLKRGLAIGVVILVFPDAAGAQGLRHISHADIVLANVRPVPLCEQVVMRGMGFAATEATALVAVKELRCEYLDNPLGIDVTEPRLSWIITSQQRGQKQKAYRILVADSQDRLKANEGNVWDSGKVESEQNLHVVYEGKPLQSARRYSWKVRIWDQNDEASPWSESACWSMGLLSETDWQAKWIGVDRAEPDRTNDLEGAQWIWSEPGSATTLAAVGTRYFRRTVTLPSTCQVEKVRCTITADDEYTLFVNGQQIGSGNNYYQVETYDVTQHFQAGANVLAVAVTNLGAGHNPAGLIAALRVETDSGEPIMVKTGSEWRVGDKAAGEWKDPGYDDTNWLPAQVCDREGISPWGLARLNGAEHTRLPARYLRREFNVGGGVKRATAYVSGLGFFELYLNGKKVGDHVLDPALTEYNKRVFYVTHDVTDLLQEGVNAVGVILGNGRYFGPGRSLTYGYPKLLLQIRIEQDDGTRWDLLSDEQWKLSTNGPIRANNAFDGEVYDARREQPGWRLSGFDDSTWDKAALVQPPGGPLAAQMIEPMRVTETIQPVAITNPQPGVYVYDMGQNMVGWVRFCAAGPRGTRITLRFAEVLRDKGFAEVAANDGMVYLHNLRSAEATDAYIFKGGHRETFEPRFSCHGFRYVEVRGLPQAPDLSDLQGKVVHSAVERIGDFRCSNDLINQIYRNIGWGVRGNVRSIPTDCPQRDERHGWLGDPTNESKGASYSYRLAPFYAKWLDDIRLDQRADGAMPNVSPAYWTVYNGDIVWPSAATIIPQWYYGFYGDRKILQDNYESMKKWMSFLAQQHKSDYTVDVNLYGDWCDASTMDSALSMEVPDSEPFGATSRPLLSSAYYYHNARLMQRNATLLGHQEDADHFADLAGKIKTGFNQRFFHPQTNKYESETQTSYLLPLAFGLTPSEHRAAVIDNLIENIMLTHKGHLSVGLVGMQWLMQTLTDAGHAETAYTIATQTTRPSWGYMIANGATTMWERWDGNTANPAMNSHNHLMLSGDFCIWLFESLAGIKCDPQQPGFKHIIMRPQVVGDLKYVKASHKSLYGLIKSDWKIDGSDFSWNITIPANTTATVYVPAGKPESVRESGSHPSQAQGVRFLGVDGAAAVYQLHSGSYRFVSTMQ